MAIVKNTVKQRLRDGKIAASFNVSRLRTVEIPQIAKACGFHWVFIDLEHSTMDLDTAGQIAGAALPVGIAPIVRDVNRAARILDAGAQGAIFPHVQNADEARAFTKACKFRPIGSRSLSYGGPQLEYEAVPAVEAMKGGNEETLVVMMIETPEAVKNAAEIAAVEGVDVLLVGGSDLSTTMGISGRSPTRTSSKPSTRSSRRRRGLANGPASVASMTRRSCRTSSNTACASSSAAWTCPSSSPAAVRGRSSSMS